MRISRLKYLSVLFSVFLLSCEMEVMLELEEMPRSIAIDAIIHSDSVFMAKLSSTVPLTGRSISNNLDGATASIINERGVRYPMQMIVQSVPFLFDLTYYVTQEEDRPQPGKSYSIAVTKEGMRPASAHFTMPEKVALSKVRFSESDFILVPAPTESFDNYRFIPITVTFNDPPGDNYYEIEVFTVRKEIVGIDPNPDNPPYILSEDYNVYQKLRTFSNNPLTNSRDFTVSLQRENSVLLFRDNEFKNQNIELEILAQFGGPANTLKELNDALLEVKVVVALRNVTREYFLYKTSLEKYFEIEGNPFAEPVNVFTNVENGLGIFTGFAQSSYRIDPRIEGDYR